MAFKTGLIVGFAAGYVLGSKAGRERYEQIRRWWDRFSGNPAVQQFAEKGKDIAAGAGRKGLSAVSTGVQKVGSSVRGRLSGEGGDGFATGEVGM
jgi:hypothetical protein